MLFADHLIGDRNLFADLEPGVPEVGRQHVAGAVLQRQRHRPGVEGADGAGRGAGRKSG
jgi:hypothetical protein